MYTYIYTHIDFIVQQKLTQHCKATILQLKKKVKKKKMLVIVKIKTVFIRK